MYLFLQTLCKSVVWPGHQLLFEQFQEFLISNPKELFERDKTEQANSGQA